MARARPVRELPRTVDEFDRWHTEQPDRWELIRGVPVGVARSSRNRTVIRGNVFTALRAKLSATGCRVYVAGVEVKERSLDVVAVPDVVVEPRPPALSPEIEEPVVLVEVMQPLGERDDSVRRWQGYCLIPSLRHHLIVDQEKPFITVHTRTGPSSFAEDIVQEGSIELAAIGASLSLDEIYEDVVFPKPELQTYA